MRGRLLIALFCLAGAPVFAASDADAPLTVLADEMEADRGAEISVFRGDVQIDKGTIHIEATEARLRAVEGEVQEGTLVGTPVIFRQAPVGEPPVAGEAKRIEYDAINRVVVLTGDAWVRQGSDEFRGETIRYDLDARKVMATSSESAPERVKLIFKPRNENPDAKPRQAPPEDDRVDAGGNEGSN